MCHHRLLSTCQTTVLYMILISFPIPGASLLVVKMFHTPSTRANKSLDQVLLITFIVTLGEWFILIHGPIIHSEILLLVAVTLMSTFDLQFLHIVSSLSSMCVPNCAFSAGHFLFWGPATAVKSWSWKIALQTMSDEVAVSLLDHLNIINGVGT